MGILWANLFSFHAEESDTDDDNASEEESDGEGWITPSNLKRYKIKNTAVESEKDELQEDIQVACITADFSIQVSYGIGFRTGHF